MRKVTTMRDMQLTIEGHVLWEDQHNRHGMRPELCTVVLMQNGRVYQMVKLNTYGSGYYKFWGLPKVDAMGRPYVYDVDEIDVPLGYEKIIADDTITNKYVNPTSVEGRIVWEDEGNAGRSRPDAVRVALLRDGIVFRNIYVTNQDGWEWRFPGVPTNQSDGTPYVYTVEEEPPVGYDAAVEGMEITNVLRETVTVTGETRWDDDGNAFRTRPKRITVLLYQNGKYLHNLKLSGQENMTFSFPGLPMYAPNGTPYRYSLDEARLPRGYVVKRDENAFVNVLMGKPKRGEAL